jgi:PTS system nitrogen regulatory IIA component
MKLNSMLTLNCTLCAVSATSKKRILEIICEQAAQSLDNFNTYSLLESLMVREKMGSTGIGKGFAIPHGRLKHSKQIIAVLATTEAPIAFDAIDNRDVDIYIALFVPEENCQEHLSTLQDIAKIFSNKQFCKQVRQCTTNQALYALIQQTNE